MKDYNDLTPMQKLVIKGINTYSDDVFNEIVNAYDYPEFWKNLKVDELSNDECVYIVGRLLSIYIDWNNK